MERAKGSATELEKARGFELATAIHSLQGMFQQTMHGRGYVSMSKQASDLETRHWTGFKELVSDIGNAILLSRQVDPHSVQENHGEKKCGMPVSH